jgi:hypothetical protein
VLELWEDRPHVGDVLEEAKEAEMCFCFIIGKFEHQHVATKTEHVHVTPSMYYSVTNMSSSIALHYLVCFYVHNQRLWCPAEQNCCICQSKF